MSKYKFVGSGFQFSEEDVEIILYGLQLFPRVETVLDENELSMAEMLSESITDKLFDRSTHFSNAEVIQMYSVVADIVDVAHGDMPVSFDDYQRCSALLRPAENLADRLEKLLPPDIQAGL